MKIMNYNVRHGFHSGTKPFKLEKERQEAAQEAVKKEDPDVLILTEACFGHENKYGIKVDFQTLFQFPHCIHAPAKPQSYEWGSAVLSKYPLSGRNLSEEWLSFLRAKVDVKGVPVQVDVFHPYPNITDQQKLDFLAKHLKADARRYVLAGDFNAISPDEYDPAKLLRGFKTFAKEPEKLAAQFLRGRTIPYLGSVGLIDTHKQGDQTLGYTIPTDSKSPNKDSGMRLDYIFCSPDWKVNRASIVKNRYTEKASDHYPVVAHLQLGDK